MSKKRLYCTFCNKEFQFDGDFVIGKDVCPECKWVDGCRDDWFDMMLGETKESDVKYEKLKEFDKNYQRKDISGIKKIESSEKSSGRVTLLDVSKLRNIE